MAIAFNKELFLKTASKGIGGGKLEPGVYNATVDKCYIDNTEKGATVIKFCFRVDEHDEHSPNATHWTQQRLTDNNGVQDEEAYGYAKSFLEQLGMPSDPEQLESISSDFENFLEKLIGTEVRIRISDNQKSPEFPYLNIKKLLRSSLENGFVSKQMEFPPKEESPVQPQDIQQTQEVELKVGDIVVVSQNNQNIEGTVTILIEETGQVMVKPANGKPILVEVSDIVSVGASTPIPVEETVEEVTVTPKLEIGMTVSGVFNGKNVQGKIYKLDETKGIVGIQVGKQGFPCPIDTVKVEIPF